MVRGSRNSQLSARFNDVNSANASEKGTNPSLLFATKAQRGALNVLFIVEGNEIEDRVQNLDEANVLEKGRNLSVLLTVIEKWLDRLGFLVLCR